MNCRACDEPNRPGAKYCKRCAAPLAPSCYGCGAPVEAEGELCATCRTERVPDTMEAEDLFPTAPEEATAITVMPYDLRPRFTGRAAALARLQRAFDEASARNEASFLVVIGEPGMGKSRLVKEAVRGFRQSVPGARVLIASSDNRGVAYAVFGRLLSSRFGITAADSTATQQEKIIAGVGDVLPAARVTEVAHLLAHLLRVPFPDSPVVAPLAESPQQLEARTFIALRRFLAADAEKAPLVLCLEDLELSGPETINLLHYLVAGLSSSPAVVIGTARASLFDKHGSFGEGDVTAVRLDLGPLEDAEAEALMRELCRPLDAVPPALVQHAKKLKGSPRALFELVRYLLEAEVIIRSGSLSWKIDADRLTGMRLPQDHDALVAERLRVMAPAERDLLEKAAVVGDSFWLDAVVALVRVAALEADDPDGPTLGEIAQAGDHTRVSVAQTLAKLVEREWIADVAESSVPGEREYRFAYPQLWTAAYESVDEARRRRYHRLVAQWLELRPEGRGAVAQEDVARHLELAGDASGAAARYRRAADAARQEFFNEKAIRLYARGLACIGETDLAARIHLWHDLGSVYELKGDFEAALGAFERMLRLAWVVASRTKAAVAFNKMGRVWRRKGDLKLALEYLARGQELFEQAQDERGIAGSLDDIGHVLYLLGRFDEAYEKITKGLAARGRGGDDRSIAHSLSNLGNIQQMRGRFNEARTCHTEALELRRATGDRAGVISSLNNLAVLAYEIGDSDAARKGWEQALDEAEEIGALPLQALALANLGELALTTGRHDEARSRLDDALAICEEIDDRRLMTEVLRNQAQLEHATGGERARAMAERALEIARSSGLRDNEGRCLVTLGDVTSGRLFDADRTDEQPAAGTLTSAETYYRRGLDLLRDIGNESELAKGLERFGRYKVERGDIAAGKSLLREALAIFSRLGMSQGSEVEKVLGAL
jgi:tetratricopeptide (TPR) repeat protein